MESNNVAPLTSFWGKVDNVCQHPYKEGCVQVTIAEQKLTFGRFASDGLQKLGLLGPPKKKVKFFVIVFPVPFDDRYALLAGWKNPPDLFVRRLQPLVVADPDSLYQQIATSYPEPEWQDFEIYI
jgi:hypothetical protein